jgi:hypothetical protein
LPTDDETLPPDLDLAEVMAAWPDLPSSIRAGVLAMVRSAVGKGRGDDPG